MTCLIFLKKSKPKIFLEIFIEYLLFSTFLFCVYFIIEQDSFIHNKQNEAMLFKNEFSADIIDILIFSENFYQSNTFDYFCILNFFNKQIYIDYFKHRIYTLVLITILISMWIILKFTYKPVTKLYKFLLNFEIIKKLKKNLLNYKMQKILTVFKKLISLILFWCLLIFHLKFSLILLILLFSFKNTSSISNILLIGYYYKKNDHFECVIQNHNEYLKHKSIINLWIKYTIALGYSDLYFLTKKNILKPKFGYIWNIIIFLFFSLIKMIEQFVYVFFYLIKNLTTPFIICFDNLYTEFYKNNIHGKNIKIFNLFRHELKPTSNVSLFSFEE